MPLQECISQFDGLSRECEAAGWPAMAKMTLVGRKGGGC